MFLLRHLPNALTCGNLLCGCWGIVLCFQPVPALAQAAYMIYAAAILDFCDGFVARLLQVSSPIGKELDSLADVVSFGVLPGFIVYQLLQAVAPGYLPLMALMVPVFSALRLAKFNVDTRQSDSFIGVPTPANAMLISALPLLAEFPDNFLAQWLLPLVRNGWAVAGLAVAMSLLLVSELPLLALKFKGFGWDKHKFQYILVGSAAILFLAFNFAALPVIIGLYIILSLIKNQLSSPPKP
jgi:CDP-diacylglycerol--serine O-phosphatidyltransferase